MKFAFASVGAALLLAANAMAQLTINTPASAVVCQPLLLTWSGGTSPYYVSVVPANQVGAAALVDFGAQTGTSLTWTVNIAAGTQIGLSVRDSTGTVAQSAPFGIQAGTVTTCVGQNPSSTSAAASGTGTSGATTTAPAATTTAPATAPAVTSARPTTTSAPATTTPKGTATGASASPSASKAAGSHAYGQVGAIGAFAVAVVAALA